jgi:hypothetical protein
MRNVIFGSLMTASLLVGGVATAQVSATIELGQPERTRIKEYVVKEKVKPTMIKEKVTVGATLPADVELAPVPSDWGPSVSKYRYVYTNDDVVLVDPTTRRVIQIIE